MIEEGTSEKDSLQNVLDEQLN